MDGKKDKHHEPGEGRAAQTHHRPGDPAHAQPGRQSRTQGQKEGPKETSRRREDDLLREEDLHDETM
ncbi:hypothetical protein [Streptomyces subrutilus]|uniref:Uncharacterized protein n=1 Tax=Streptomyces subrutilus TaxID=36818 RepID=A0A1E5PSY9_9ACTN|nr:hypothetical protein [Streptomyces subrutilus]OEJ32695.1 hypothetical protein BGK67_16380 [Streptomyces subrutilus]